MWCTWAGDRAPVIRWTKVDGVLPVDHVTHDGTLIINQVSAEDAGVYQCIATGEYRTTRSLTELFIIGLMAFSSLRDDHCRVLRRYAGVL